MLHFGKTNPKMFAILQSLGELDFRIFEAPPAAWRRKFVIRSLAVELAGVEFIDENGGGPGVRLRNPAAAEDHKALGAFQLLTIVDLTTLTAYIGKWFSSGTKQRAGVPSTNEGFGFEYAARIFLAPTLERPDDRREYGEVRIQAIGRVGDDMLFVVYTDRGDIRHIISARLANRKERRLWQSFAEQWKTSAE